MSFHPSLIASSDEDCVHGNVSELHEHRQPSSCDEEPVSEIQNSATTIQRMARANRIQEFANLEDWEVATLNTLHDDWRQEFQAKTHGMCTNSYVPSIQTDAPFLEPMNNSLP